MKELAKSGDLAVDLAGAFDASPNPYVLLSPDLVIRDANKAYLDVTARQRDQIIGRRMFDAFDPGPAPGAQENKRQLQASFDRVLETGEADHLALIHYAISVPGPAGEEAFEDRYWSATHTPLKDDAGRIAYILQHTTDITELHTLRQGAAAGRGQSPMSALDAIVSGGILQRAESVQADNRRLEGERNRLVDIFMQAPGFIAVLDGRDQRVQMHNAAYGALIGRDDIAGQTVREAMPELEGQGYHELLDQVFTTGEPYEGRAAKVSFIPQGRSDRRDHFIDFTYQPIRGADGEIAGIFVQGHDVTDIVLAAERQKLMIDELNHRVKNTLATVQSIAVQTARSHADPRNFAEAFQARLLALSHTHDLLTRSYWEGAALTEILRHETEAHGARRVTLNGPPVELEPAAALSWGMIFHELATNAAKYGALSSEAGRVHVDWTVDAAPRRLHLVWREMGGPKVSEPQRRGFGSRLIERNVRHDLAGEAKLDYASGGFVAEFSVPLDRSGAG